MWRRTALVMVLILTQQVAKDSYGQEPSLVAQQPWVRFDVVFGRIVATHLRGGQGRRVREEENLPFRETLAINGNIGAPSLRYERNEGSLKIELSVVDHDRFDMSFENAASGVSVSYRQLPRRPVVLTVNDGDAPTKYRAPSLWHLLVSHREPCEEHLIPLLEYVRCDWRLMETCHNIQTELFRVARDESPAKRRLVLQLVDELAARNFSQRQAADRELRKLGVAVLPYFNQLETESLTGEQRLRIHRIRTGLSVVSEDRPTRVATWLVNDRGIWISLLTHQEPSKRSTAADHLTGIHPGLEFDPHADETRRMEQIETLRLVLAGQ